MSRSLARVRRIANENQLTATLQERGYESVQLETLSLRDQVELVTGTNRIVGMHGAGLVHMLWASDHTRVLELRDWNDAGNNCYFSLARALGFGYYYLKCLPAEAKDEFVVAPDTLADALDALV